MSWRQCKLLYWTSKPVSVIHIVYLFHRNVTPLTFIRRKFITYHFFKDANTRRYFMIRKRKYISSFKFSFILIRLSFNVIFIDVLMGLLNVFNYVLFYKKTMYQANFVVFQIVFTFFCTSRQYFHLHISWIIRNYFWVWSAKVLSNCKTLFNDH